MAIEWHATKNGDATPADFWTSSNKKVWLVCRVCKQDRHQVISDVTNGGVGCGFCKNKTEKRVYTHIKSTEPSCSEHDYRPEWCRSTDTGYHRPYDMCTWWPGTLPIIDEVDGPQHFVQVSNWVAPETTQQNDAEKILKAIENGHHVRRLVQEDVWTERVDWRGWIAETNTMLHAASAPTLCLPLPRSQWKPLLAALAALGDVPVVLV